MYAESHASMRELLGIGVAILITVSRIMGSLISTLSKVNKAKIFINSCIETFFGSSKLIRNGEH